MSNTINENYNKYGCYNKTANSISGKTTSKSAESKSIYDKSNNSQMDILKAAQILNDNMSVFDQAAGLGKKDQTIGYHDLVAMSKNNKPEYKQQREAAQYILHHQKEYSALGNKSTGLIGTKELQNYLNQRNTSKPSTAKASITSSKTSTTNTSGKDNNSITGTTSNTASQINTTKTGSRTNTTNAVTTSSTGIVSSTSNTANTNSTTSTANTGKTTNAGITTTATGTGKSLFNVPLGKNAFDDPNWQKDLNVTSGWRMENSKVVDDPTGRYDNVLRTTYQAGVSNTGGTGFWTKTAPTDHAFLKYSLKPSDNFEFVLGGKLPGLYGGDGNSGGKTPDGTDGFSTRFMWREGGKGEGYSYLPPIGGQKGVDGTWGIEQGKGSFNFKPGEWTDLEQEVKMNTPGKDDGILRLWANGKMVYEKTNVTYRTTDDLKIDGMFFSTFYGGSGSDWAPSKTTSMDFANFQISDKFIP